MSVGVFPALWLLPLPTLVLSLKVPFSTLTGLIIDNAMGIFFIGNARSPAGHNALRLQVLAPVPRAIMRTYCFCPDETIREGTGSLQTNQCLSNKVCLASSSQFCNSRKWAKGFTHWGIPPLAAAPSWEPEGMAFPQNVETITDHIHSMVFACVCLYMNSPTNHPLDWASKLLNYHQSDQSRPECCKLNSQYYLGSSLCFHGSFFC